MDFPVKLYHWSTDAFVASGYPTYPINISTQAEYDALPAGWFTDPVEAGEYPQVLQRLHDAPPVAPIVNVAPIDVKPAPIVVTTPVLDPINDVVIVTGSVNDDLTIVNPPIVTDATEVWKS